MEQEKLKAFEQELRDCIKGEVYFDDVTLGLYATDASMYQIRPMVVVLPFDETDVKSAVEVVAKYGVNILPRGSATSLNGQCVNSGMIIDFTKYMNKIIEINAEKCWARVQPGVILDELNTALAKYGLLFAPDPATGNRATIGGMIGNNASGTRSIVYGITRQHVLETKVLLADGTEMELKGLSRDEYNECAKENNRLGQIFNGFKNIIKANHDEIEKRFPKVMRRVQGYNLDSFVGTDNWNMAELIVGSEGTLGIVLEAKLHLEPLPKAKALCAVHFAELSQAIGTVEPILKHNPSAIEILDFDLIDMAREDFNAVKPNGLIQGQPQGILLVEFFGENSEQAREKTEKLVSELQGEKHGYAWPIITEPAEQAKIWTIRKNGLGLLLNLKGDRKPQAFIEDTCVPTKFLPEYIDQILKFCKSIDVPIVMYAHASVGTIHLRPRLNLKAQEDIEHMKAISDFVFGLIVKYGGSWSGEHGDGRARSPKLESFFGTKLYNAMRQVKLLFDPDNLMNPGIIIDPNPMDQDLRYGTNYKTNTFSTEYHYRDSGSFAEAVETCSGVGVCRQNLEGTMCPSYRATGDEEASTRGRANALRLAMTGQLGPDAMTSKRMFEVMDLCLACKSCKSECPSNVDLTRLKSEFLQKYHDAHGVGLRERMIANSPLMARMFSGWMAPIVNFFQRSRPFRKILEITAGFDSRRVPPEYSSKPLNKWFVNRQKPVKKLTKKIVLFDDTYMKYHQTNVGISAVELLESCGYEVVLANAGCCQRPKISHGFLRDAKVNGEKTLRNLDKFIQQGLKIVVCEPGCASALTDDLPDLIEDEQLGIRIKENVTMIDEFLVAEIKRGHLDCEFISPFENILIHGHCHQKSLFGTTAMKEILDRVPGISVSEISSGCCGMAGSFGYEKEHYDMSLQIGEETLFPAVRNRKNGTAVVACGFSCRHQIADGTGVTALHWVETLRGTAVNT